MIRLSQLLTPDTRISLVPRIAGDLDEFLGDLIAEGTHNPKDLEIDLSLAEVTDRVRRAYGTELDSTRQGEVRRRR